MFQERLLKIYYLGTPLFFLLDFFAGMNVRVAGLETLPALKYGYYALCMGAGGAMIRWPNQSAVFSLVECVTNIVTLILSVMLPQIHAIEALSAGADPPAIITVQQVINFIGSGFVLLISFYRNPLIRG